MDNHTREKMEEGEKGSKEGKLQIIKGSISPFSSITSFLIVKHF